jgi:hypothetical protein
LSKGRDGKELKVSASKKGRVVIGERILAVSGYGDVVEFNEGRWTHRYAPPSRNMPLHDAYIAWDAAAERLVVWDGGSLTRSGRVRRKSMTTWFFERESWRLSKHAPPADETDRFPPELVFDPLIGRVVRLWEHELAVLEGDAWRIVEPEGFAYGTLFVDPKTKETLLYTDDALWRFDLGQFHQVASVAAYVGPENNAYVDVSYHAKGRRLVSENSDDPKATCALDLAPAFDAAARMGPRA